MPVWKVIQSVLLLIFCARNVEGFTYSCEDIRNNLIDVTFPASLTYACIVVQEGFSNNAQLDELYLFDDQKHSFAYYAGHCIGHSFNTAWTVKSDVGKHFDCAQEFSLIMSSVPLTLSLPTRNDESYVSGSERTLAVPQTGIRCLRNDCGGAGNVSFSIGAGNGESELEYEYRSWPSLEAATQMFADGLKSKPERASARQVIYYVTDSNLNGDMNSFNLFKNSQGVIIVNELLKEKEPEHPGLSELASDGFYFSSGNYMQGLQSFCQANCFCTLGLDSYGGFDQTNMPAGGCYHPASAGVPFNKAKSSCAENGGVIATIHDDDKGRFLQELLTETSAKSDYFWVGYEKSDEGKWTWEDQSTDPYTNWDVNEPSSATVAKCAYVDTTNPKLPWGAGNCQLGFPHVCQYTPCSVGNKNC